MSGEAAQTPPCIIRFACLETVNEGGLRVRSHHRSANNKSLRVQEMGGLEWGVSATAPTTSPSRA